MHSAAESDVFAAIAEPRRRELIGLLGNGRLVPVGSLVRSLRLPQPAVSKHLGVLRRAKLVTVSKQGRQRLYQLNAGGLKPVQDWLRQYDRYLESQADRIKKRAEAAARKKEK